MEPRPSVSRRTRSPCRPRSTGREAVGPNELADTPGVCCSVSPMDGRSDWVSCAPWTTATLDSMSPRWVGSTPETTISRLVWW